MAPALNETPVENAADTAPESPAEDQQDVSTGGDDEGANVSPQEQKQYDTIVTACFAMMYKQPGIAMVIQKLMAEKANIAQGIGHTAAMIIISVKGGIEKQGGHVPGDILYAAGQEVIADLIEIAVGSGLMEEKDTDEVAQKALFYGLKTAGNYINQQPDKARQMDANQQLADAGAQVQIDGKTAGVGGGQQQPQAPAQPQPPGGGIVNAGVQQGAPQ